MDLSVIIVNWNALQWLERCLTSALAQDLGGRTMDIWLVDNNSHDGSVDYVRNNFPQVQVLPLRDNRGFAAGNNAAIPRVDGKNIFLLNPDTESYAGSFKALLEFMDQHPRCGIVGPKMVYPNGDLQYSCRRFPTLEAALFRNRLLERLLPGDRGAGDYLMKTVPHDKAMPVDWVSGSALMVRREVIDQIGMLDEGYFFAVEEVDFCYRAREAGWEVWYEPASVIMHAIGHSSDQNPRPVIIAHHKGMMRFYRKFYLGRRYPRWLTPIVGAALTARASAVMALGLWHKIRRPKR